VYERFTLVDGLTRPDHYFIEPDDRCYYLGEYTPRQDFSFSETNGLIKNLKKKMNLRGTPQWRYKGEAIRTCGANLRKIFGNDKSGMTFVPVPPSKIVGDPGYDDRLIRVLDIMAGNDDCDIRQIVTQVDNMEPSHEGDRATIQSLIDNYSIDQGLLQQPRGDTIAIFDDMLTTGRHFRAMHSVLSERFPRAQFFGIFIARRRLPSAAETFSNYSF